MKIESYIDHIEAHLGPIRRKFSGPIGKLEAATGLLSFEGRPFDEATTVLTCGLSHHPLEQDSGRGIRQELVMCGFTESVGSEFANVLDRVSSDFLEIHKPLKRGQVIGPRGPLLKGASVEALVCAEPWYWEDSFGYFDQVDPPIVIVWLIPVTPDEAFFIRERGLDAFEKIIDDEGIDLLDFTRDSARAVSDFNCGCQ